MPTAYSTEFESECCCANRSEMLIARVESGGSRGRLPNTLRSVPARRSKAENRHWQISRVAKKAIYLGQVEAADAETAIKRAIEKYDIAVEHRDRLAARPIMRASQP